VAVTVDDLWKQQAESFGRYLRAQRKLADLSLREVAAMADVSNAYVSQLERGLHQPSVRVLRALAEALNVSSEKMLTQAGVLEGDDPADEPAAPATEPQAAASRRSGSANRAAAERSLTEGAILADPLLSAEQKQALLAVYHGFLEIS
jgi:transcriptional regulator with XRE-family HTH domain